MKNAPTYKMNLKWFRPLYFPILLPVALLIALYNKLSPIPFKIYQEANNLLFTKNGRMD